MADAVLEIFDPVVRVVHALLESAIQSVATPRKNLRDQRIGGVLFSALVPDENLRERDLGDVFARLLVDDLHGLTLVEELCDALERDVAAGFGVVELAVGIALDQDCHGASLARDPAQLSLARVRVASSRELSAQHAIAVRPATHASFHNSFLDIESLYPSLARPGFLTVFGRSVSRWRILRRTC